MSALDLIVILFSILFFILPLSVAIFFFIKGRQKTNSVFWAICMAIVAFVVTSFLSGAFLLTLAAFVG